VEPIINFYAMGLVAQSKTGLGGILLLIIKPKKLRNSVTTLL
jgi:hypothetical protein